MAKPTIRLPEQLQSIIDDHRDVISLELGSKHIKVRVGGEMVAVYTNTRSGNTQTIKNSVARLRRELRNRGLLKESKT